MKNKCARLVDDLEVRFLGNHDRNMHFALVSDLPDSDHAASEDNRADRSCLISHRPIERAIRGAKYGIVFSLPSPPRL